MPRTGEREKQDEEVRAPEVQAPAPRAPAAVVNVLAMQRGVGNAAVAQMLARKDDDAGATPAPAPGIAPGAGPAVPLGEAISKRDFATIVSAAGPDYSKLSKAQKVDAIFVVLHDSAMDADAQDALNSLWWSFELELPDMMHLYYSTWKECVDKGVKLTRWSLYDMFDLFGNIAPEVITSHQAGRVMPAVLKLADDEYQRLRKKLYFALTGVQRAYIEKALAAGRSIDDIEIFADTIQLKSDEWLKTNLNVVEESDAGGKGISQQWQMSCGPTTVQVLHAQTDPIYALSLTSSGNLNKTGVGASGGVGGSATSKAEQGTMLKGQGSNPTELGTDGTGAWVETDMEGLKASTGLKYTNIMVTAILPANPKDGVIDKALDKIAGWLDQGMYVPIVIGGTPGSNDHYNMLLRHDSTKGFLSHDPGKGKSAWVTRQNFMDNTLVPPLSWKLLAGYDEPAKS